MIRILAIGDIVGLLGCRTVYENLENIKHEYKIDFVIANGENSAVGNGITKKSAEYLLSTGIDIITGGNHSFKKHEFINYIAKSQKIIRPANYPEGTPGNGFLEIKIKNSKIKICIINISGLVYLEPLSCPIMCLDKILEKTQNTKIKILDFHAEATAEKRAMGFYADGKISAMFGTHTHVQTSDEEILPNGTAYITDIGMCGAVYSVLGVKPEIAIKRMKHKIPIKFEHDKFGPSKIECAYFDIDEITGKALNIKRLRFNFN